MAISDVAYNPLAGVATGYMLGYVEPPESAEELQLEMYDFIIWPIREKDQIEGKLFLKRFLEGPQQEWRDTQARIFAIKDLWSVTKCPDEFLKYLKNIVGWTAELEHITKELDDATLRRLISASVPLWKTRSTRDSIANVLSLVTGERLRVWNWFDFRWVLDETEFSEEHQGRDPWIIDLPGSGEEYWMNVRIVDPGTFQRQLVKDVLNLMRPTGERFEITYLDFLDLFKVDGDASQWDILLGGNAPTVTGGMARFTDDTSDEGAIVNVEGSDDWENYVVSARLRGSKSTFGLVGYGIALYVDVDALDGFGVLLSVRDNKVYLVEIDNAIGAVRASFDFGTIGYTLQPDVWYGVRAQAYTDGTDVKFKIYVDNNLCIDFTDNTPITTKGKAGIIHNSTVVMDCDELEVLGLPAETDTVEINS